MERIFSTLALVISAIALTMVLTVTSQHEHTEPESAAPTTDTPTPASEPSAVPVENLASDTGQQIDSTNAAPTTLQAPRTPAPVIDALSTGIDASAPDGNWEKPALLEQRVDPAYGTPVTRLTSAAGTRFDRNTYSRRNPENVDGSLFFTYHGDATYNVYGVADGDLVTVTEIHPDGEPQWHPSDPNRLRFLAGDDASSGELVLYETDVRTGLVTAIADLSEPLTAQYDDALYLSDRAEGTPSQDGNRYAWLVYDDEEDPIAVVTYDLSNNSLGGVLDISETPGGRTDWVSVSPTGENVVLSGESGVFAYDFNLTNSRQLHDKAEHSDIALSASGDDVYVHVDFSADSPTAGWVVARNLQTGQTTRFFDLYDNANTSIHFSGKAYDAPGWVVASTYNCKEDFAWSCEKVFAFNIDTGEIVNLAHTYNCGEAVSYTHLTLPTKA